MLVQPYIENAIKHGLLHKKTDKRLSIDLKLDEQQSILICTIEDNGVGRAKSEEMKKFRPQRHKSFGTSATRRRLELLNYNREKAIAVKFIDKINEKGEASGTTVIIEIPITQQ
jgi:sensor histidine kinase YesM